MTPPPKISYGAIGWLLWPMCRIADEVKKLGLGGIEGFGLTDLLPGDENLGKHLKETGVTFVGSYYGGSLVEPAKIEAEMQDFENTVREIVKLEGSIVAVGGGRVFPGKEKENWPRLIQSVHRMARIARKHGVRLGFHPHVGTMVYSEKEIERFAAETDPAVVGFTFDTAHAAEAGMDICDQFRKHHARVVHVHLKDLSGNDFVELGEGNLPLEDFLRELLGCGYGGWLTVELDAAFNPVESAKVSIDHLNSLLTKMESPPRS